MIVDENKSSLIFDLAQFKWMLTGNPNDRFNTVPLWRIGENICKQLVFLESPKNDGEFTLEFKKRIPVYKAIPRQPTSIRASYDKDEDYFNRTQDQVFVTHFEQKEKARLSTPPTFSRQDLDQILTLER